MSAPLFESNAADDALRLIAEREALLEKFTRACATITRLTAERDALAALVEVKRMERDALRSALEEVCRCPRCGGSGRDGVWKCALCHGVGRDYHGSEAAKRLLGGKP